MKMNEALKIKSEQIEDVILSICKTSYFYDIIIEGSLEKLNSIKSQLDIDSDIIEDGVYGNPILVLDTCDSEEDANHIFNEIKDRI